MSIIYYLKKRDIRSVMMEKHNSWRRPAQLSTSINSKLIIIIFSSKNTRQGSGTPSESAKYCGAPG